MIDRDTVLPRVKKIPGPKARRFTSFSKKHMAVSTLDEGFVWARDKPAIGPWCTDIDGNIILDFVSHIASAPLGYNHPRITEMMTKIGAIDPDRYAGTDFLAAYDYLDIPTPGHLHQKVVEITKQFGFDTAFFSNSGAEAVENAIKICYSTRKNDGYGICFEGAFHGRTLGALSLNRSKAVQRTWYPHVPNIVDFPYCQCSGKCQCGWNTVSKKGDVENVLKQFLDKDIGIAKPEEVSYVIIEPIQGEGGYRFPNKNFIREVFKEAQSRGIPMIADEIQSGMGRTGTWWACEQYGVKPDVLTSAKALRVGATISKRHLFPKEKGRISSTWAEGNAIASAVGCVTIDVIKKEKLLLNAHRVGNYFLRRLREIRSRKVADVRGLGLMDAIEFDTRQTRNMVIQRSLKKGLLLAAVGYKSIRFLPPLNVTKREVDVAVHVLENALKK